MRALSWLHVKNVLYSDVQTNMNWCVDARSDDSDMFSGLIGESKPNDVDGVVANVNVHRPVISEYDKHYNILVNMTQSKGFVIHDILGDGNCQFNAVGYQLDSNDPNDGETLRAMTIAYLRQNPYVNQIHQGDFMSDDIAGEIAKDITVPLPAELKWDVYLEHLKEGAWGDPTSIVQSVPGEHQRVVNSWTECGSG